MSLKHEFPPVYREDSRILILGSFPSVKSREQGFFYGHPQNRFWKLMAALTDEEIPGSIEEKKGLLLRHGIAIWDVIESCDITGSSDASIRNVIPQNLHLVLDQADIRVIYGNGAAATKLYRKYQEPLTGRVIRQMPSTSPANAACTMSKLIDAWCEIRQYLLR